MSVTYGSLSLRAEILARGGCRKGLIGLIVRARDTQSQVRIHGTFIDRHGSIMCVCKEPSVPADQAPRMTPSEYGFILMGRRDSGFFAVNASDLILVDPWPALCCPRRADPSRSASGKRGRP